MSTELVTANPASLLVPEPAGRRLVFFAGKGGVGKTVLACATAVWLAEEGHKVLLVTTDPAAHLADVLECAVWTEPIPVSGVTNLSAARVDQKQAASEYRKRVLEEASHKYGPDMISAMREELESPCTEEMAAFEKFIELATRPDYEVVVVDTAPTGHTLRLLELPLDWDRQLEVMVAAKPGTDVHRETKARYDQVIAMLRSPEQTKFIFVVYPENTPIIEAYRASEDLKRAGIETALVIANQVLLAEHCTTPFFRRRYDLQRRYLGVIEERFGVPTLQMPLLAQEIRGLPLLRTVGESLWAVAK